MDEIECIKCIYNINNECEIGGWTIPKIGCPDGKAKPMIKADRFRSMTDEEMAEWFAGHDAGLIANVLNNDYVAPTKGGWLEWLKGESDKTNEQTN